MLTPSEQGVGPKPTGQKFSDRQLRLMVDSVLDYAIIMLDPDGRVMSWNAGAERIKGYSEAEILGQHFSKFYPRSDLEDHKPDHDLRTAARTGHFEDRGWRVRKDGSSFWANVVI